MTIHFTADLHLFHERILELGRPVFSSVKQMHEHMADHWNTRVAPHDTVYLLGDITFASNVMDTYRFLEALKGQKFLVRGNHDHTKRIRGLAWAGAPKDRDEIRIQRPDGAYDYLVLSHEPKLSWHRMHRGAYHLHGHCHGNLRLPQELANARILDVGVDVAHKLTGAYAPMSWEFIKEHLKDKAPASIDHHEV